MYKQTPSDPSSQNESTHVCLHEYVKLLPTEKRESSYIWSFMWNLILNLLHSLASNARKISTIIQILLNETLPFKIIGFDHSTTQYERMTGLYNLLKEAHVPPHSHLKLHSFYYK
jgi:hypothetical protein